MSFIDRRLQQVHAELAVSKAAFHGAADPATAQQLRDAHAALVQSSRHLRGLPPTRNELALEPNAGQVGP